MKFGFTVSFIVGVICVCQTGLPQQLLMTNPNRSNSVAPAEASDTERQLFELRSVESENRKIEHELSSQIERLISKKDFTGLDALADSLRKSKKHTADGRWHLRTFYLLLSFDTPGRNDVIEKRRMNRLVFLQSWIEAKQESITARVALGSFYASYAWHARGSGYANTVTEDGWRLFRERLELAKRTLDGAKKLEAKCPAWWDIMQRVALGQSWDLTSYNKLFDEAVAFEPNYISYYTRKAVYVMPRWLGNEGDWQKFATKSADNLGGEAGDILYARLGWFIHSERFYEGFLEDSGYSWPRMKRGMEAIIGQYPQSDSAASELAYLAHQKKDQECARPLFQRLGNQVDQDVWRLDLERYLRAKTWALSR